MTHKYIKNQSMTFTLTCKNKSGENISRACAPKQDNKACTLALSCMNARSLIFEG